MENFQISLVKNSIILFLVIICSACHGKHTARIKNKDTIVSPKPNILLLTIDTLRADHLSCYGYTKSVTYSIDRLAAEGARFTRAYTPVPITLPSHASIMTGKYPISHGVMDNGVFVLDDREETLAESLQKADYECAAFIGSFVLDSQFGLDQGFDFYADNLDPNKPAGAIKQLGFRYPERSGDSVTNDFIKWLDSYKASDTKSPFFAWVHYFDPHFTYEPPEPFSAQFKDNPYDGEIMFTDFCLKRIFDTLSSYSLLDSTWIILVGDHGEGLGEHKEKYHGVFLYNSTLHVPLIMRYPALITPAVVSSQIRTIDIAPTILNVLGIKPFKEADGVSFAKLFEGESIDDSTLYCQSEYGMNGYGWAPLEGIQQDEWKYIKAPYPELYNIKKDNEELHNLIDEKPDKASEMRQALDTIKSALEKHAHATAPTPMDSETAQKLFSLGYVFRGDVKSEDYAELPDPKDRIELLDDMDMATYYHEKGNDEKALERFKKVIALDPKNLYVHSMIGIIHQNRREYDRAEAAFLNVLKIRSDYLDIHLRLAGIYEAQGRFPEALEQLELGIETAKKKEDVYYAIGLLYEKRGNYELAIENFNKALDISPKQYKIYYSLGSIYHKQGLLSEAISHYKRCIELNPYDPAVYNNLGLLYFDKNQLTEAKEAMLRAIELAPDIDIQYKNLGDIYFKEKEYEKAAELILKSITLNPSSYQAYNSLGNVYFMQKEYNKALDQFKKAVGLAPNFTQAQFNLSYTLYSLGRISEAIEALRETIRLDPYFPQARFLLEKARQEISE
ncbi:MAG: tetratricopeptide repeat protein [bacterium]